LDFGKQYFYLEKGIFVGFILLVFGIVLSIIAFKFWAIESFGNLEPTKIFRIIIPAVLLMVLGVRTMLNSFFLSILGLKK